MTRLGLLITDVQAGREVPGVSEHEMHRLCADLAKSGRYLRAHRGPDNRYLVALVGPPMEAR